MRPIGRVRSVAYQGMIILPQKTFLNLPENRRKEILNACFEEFALNDYESASLSSIISKLGLAKGSFYRYFESKLDLYNFLCQFANSLVAANFVRYLNGSGKDFFQDWAGFFLSLSEIEKEYPMAIRFRFKAAFEQSSEVSGQQNIEKPLERMKFMSDVLRKYQENGLIRKDIDLDFFSLLMTFFNFTLSEYIGIKYKIPQTSPLYSVDHEILKQDTEKLLDIVRRGWLP